MFRIYTSFLKQMLFWLLFFALGRTIFLIYYSSDVINNSDSFLEILNSFVYGFKLDLATSCYFMVFPLLVHLVMFFYSPAFIHRILQVYHSIIIILYSFLIAGELGIYAEWQTKINYKALSYLQNPSEVMGTAQNSQIIILSLVVVLMSSLGIFFYSKFFHTKIIRLQTPPASGVLFFIIMPPLLLLAARGGIQEIPISQSQSFYSKHSILNTAATNSVFNLWVSYYENRDHLKDNPFKNMDRNTAEAIVENIYKAKSDSTTKILTIEKPNIVLVILESWSSDLIDIPDGKKEVVPEFNKLITQGIYFDSIYATGARSEQGMASIFSGFPAHPISSITVQPDKYRNLPSIVKDLNAEGYSTSFLFGGQLIYGNIKSYILYNEFDVVKEGHDFDKDIPRGKLGIHDEFMMTELINQINNSEPPFFASLFTSSSHSPFDHPMGEIIKWGDREQKYLNSAHYTDKCIGEFIRNAKKQDWYDNTLFIFVADHSHRSYKNHFFKSHTYQKIPMLLYGNVIQPQYKGTKIDRLGIQTNIAATVLGQLDIPVDKYKWSVNMFNPTAPEFAYISYVEGFNWVRPAGVVNYEQRYKKYHYYTGPKEMRDSLDQEGKAYMQVLFQEYMDH